MVETKKTEQTKSQEDKAVSALRFDVTLVRRGSNNYEVLQSDGKPLMCKCGRPVSASLHNISVPKRLGPCSLVVIKQDE